MVRLEHVTYRYRPDGPAVLNDISLSLKPGQSVCLMGRNGSGKSTVARVIAGLLQPTQGTVTIAGRSLDDPDNRPPVGILFQNPDNQMVATLVEKEIAFALENRAVPQDAMETAISRVCERFEISHLRRRLTSELSGGEKQRVALASVMIQRPNVLVLDEADAFLDAAGRKVLQSELNAIRGRDLDLVEIRITQQAQVGRNYARLIVLDQGTVAADGPSADILNDDKLMTSLGLKSAEVLPVAVLPDVFSARHVDHRVARVEADELDFEYAADSPVLKETSLQVGGGDTVAVVGATGAGKSSLGLLLCGILKAAGGRVVCRDGTGAELSPRACRGQVVNLLQQSERQFFLATCAEEVTFGPENLGRMLTTGEIADFFALVGLAPDLFSDRDPFSLSGGEKRRLAFASVLSMAPRVVVFDEPTAGLDAEGIGRFLAISRALKQADVGQVLISHSEDVVRELADRVVVLRRGERLRTMPADEFFASQQFGELLAHG
ncbi:MAG: ATP-binding cassette domain-containing protein [candidate division Zixibacteria bacterium]|nr:ATP-binding cassette domain-containing protein [candidate division Zixibacteria bacterium]